MSAFFLLFTAPLLALFSFFAVVVAGSRAWLWLAGYYRAILVLFDELFDFGWRL